MANRSRSLRTPSGWAARRFLALPLSLPLLLACALLLTGTACGRRTPPQPLGNVLPPVSALTVRQQGDGLLIAWLRPDPTQTSSDVRGYRVTVARYGFDCSAKAVRCHPEEVREISLDEDSPQLMATGKERRYLFLPQVRQASWRIEVAAEYRSGESRPAVAPLVQGLATIPVHGLRWEWGASMGDDPPPVRLSWQRFREKTVRVMTDGGAPVERGKFYRVNLYRRPAGATWPPGPLNPQPLEGEFWVDGAPAGEVEYTLRLVDSLGGEGAAADPVRVKPAGDAP